MLIDDLKRFDICPPAAMWLADRIDQQQAWNECKNGGWMILWSGLFQSRR